MAKYTQFQDNQVKAKFDSYPKDIKQSMMLLRQLIFDVALRTPGIGPLEETLKWGEPSYVTSQTKSGSTVRIDWKKSAPDQYAVYFNCKTTLVDTLKTIYGDTFRYSGNRSILFNIHEKIPVDALEDCLIMSLTYHLNKRKK
jgi:hypothetical protein